MKAKETEGALLTVTPPKDLGSHGKEVWRWAVAVCKEAGRPLRKMHAEVLSGLCHASSDVISAGAIIERDGYLVEGGREGMKRHPATSIRAQALTIKRAYLAELGLTPTSSSRLPAGTSKQDENPFAEF